ncbi:MAG: PEPxxWA-CTERM sorting domain-containing protein [Sphingobium sp.]
MAFATPAAAVVVLTPGPYTSAATTAVNTTGAQTGTSVTGVTAAGVGFTFTSPSVLTTNASGQLRISGPFQTLSMTSTSDDYGFKMIDFTLDVLKFNTKKSFYADLVLNLVGGGSILFDNVLLTKGGNTQFTITGDAGEAFNSFSVTGFLNAANTEAGSFARVSDIDVDAVHLTSGVPEPTTWAMMIAGIGLVGASMRRRRTSGQAALA